MTERGDSHGNNSQTERTGNSSFSCSIMLCLGFVKNALLEFFWALFLFSHTNRVLVFLSFFFVRKGFSFKWFPGAER